MALRLTSLLLFLIISSNGYTQKSPSFFELIAGDSVNLFLNENKIFTEKACAEFTRSIRVTESGDFNGYFEDIAISGSLLGKGTYSNGVKHGYFELFFPNGKIQAKGYYENNKPVGVWEFFYENGLPERTLSIDKSVTRLLLYVDREGTLKVQNGNGKIVTTIPFLPFLPFQNIPVTGTILNGLPHGTWKAMHPNDKSALYVEKFDNGKLVKTSLIRRKKISSRTPSLIANLFPENYLFLPEGFYFQHCMEDITDVKDRWSNSAMLRADLSRKIDLLIETDFRNRDTDHYIFGDNFMTIRFNVTDKGKAENIELISDWGTHFFDAVKNSISRSRFATNTDMLYFRLKVSYAGGRRYRYTFKFSKKPE